MPNINANYERVCCNGGLFYDIRNYCGLWIFVQINVILAEIPEWEDAESVL